MELSPFLLFEGMCADAMRFYQSCLGGQLSLTRVAETPMKDQLPESEHDKIAYARLTSGSITISATDWLHPTRMPRQGNTVALYLDGRTHEEIERAFTALAAGADPQLLDELRELPFGSYGHLADRYGVHWFFRAQVN